MKYTLAYKPHVSHFHRWSRKAYAVFSSLGKQVVIDRACKSIAEASLRKSVAMSLSSDMLSNDSSDDKDECLSGEEMDAPFSCLASVTVVMSGAALFWSKSGVEACASCHSALTEGNIQRFFDTRNTFDADDAKVNESASSALFVPVQLFAGVYYYICKRHLKYM